MGAAARTPNPDTHDSPMEHDLAALMEACKKAGFLPEAAANRPQGKEKPLFVQDFCTGFSSYGGGQEREVLSFGGDQRLLVSSSRKITPENTTLPQWIRGHLKIQEVLIERGELSNMAGILAYERYGQKISDMCTLYPLNRVMRFDVEYRIKVFEGALQWGDLDPELMNFCIFTQYIGNTQKNQQRKREHMPSDPHTGKEICRNYNIVKGCERTYCRFAHVCLCCFKNHPEHKHA